MKLSEARQLLEEGYRCAEIAKLADVKIDEIRDALGIDTNYVKKLIQRGHIRAEIEVLTGSALTWVDKQIKYLKMKPRDGRRTLDRDRALELYREGKNDSEIARELGCTPPGVYGWRKKNGLKSNWRNGK